MRTERRRPADRNIWQPQRADKNNLRTTTGRQEMSAYWLRGVLLLLLLGHLLLRREFAHRSVGELFGVTSAAGHA